MAKKLELNVLEGQTIRYVIEETKIPSYLRIVTDQGMRLDVWMDSGFHNVDWEVTRIDDERS